MNSVLSGLNFNLQPAIHFLIANRQDWSSGITVEALTGVNIIYTCVSSAKMMVDVQITGNKFTDCWSYNKHINNNGPRTEPWGTPHLRDLGQEIEVLILTLWVQFEIYEWNHSNASSHC